jgi:hypothetical protein
MADDTANKTGGDVAVRFLEEFFVRAKVLGCSGATAVGRKSLNLEVCCACVGQRREVR